MTLSLDFTPFPRIGHCIQFGLGQLVRNVGGDATRNWIIAIKPVFTKICETLLLFIIFCAISQSFFSGLDAGYLDIISMCIVILFLHIITLIAVWFLSALRADRNVDGAEGEQGEGEGAMRSGWERCCECKDEWMRFNIYDRIATMWYGV